jgi:murein DD-endopeptidase MepM/ murein hydrolase activator NlpD
VVIDHGASVYSIYMHQSKIVAKVGETVSRGQQIGEVGTTGLSTGPHLHWEIRVNQVATNPLTWVGKLLP